MSSSGCKSSLSCIDARRPVRPTYVNLYKWPESDAEFVKSVTEGRRGESGSARSLAISGDGLNERRKWRPSPGVVDSYSCRQMYLRSYPFSKEEPVAGKAKQYLGRARQRAAVLIPFLRHKTDAKMNSHERMTRKEKKKGCLTNRKLIKELSHSTLLSIFYRFIFCTTSIEVSDRR